MPLILRESSWDQNDSHVFVTIVFNHVIPKSADIFTSPKYVKVSLSPYFYELYLFAEIDDLRSIAEISSNQIVLRLPKARSQRWESLRHEKSNDPEIMRQVRAEAMEYAAARLTAEAAGRKEAKREKQGFAVTEHTAVETSRKALLQKAKDEEKTKTLQSYSFSDEPGSDSTVRAPPNETDELSDEETEQELLHELGLLEDPVNAKDPTKFEVPSEAFQELLQKIAAVDSRRPTKKTAKVTSLPDVRSAGTITFTPTERVFPTPRRESKIAEEEEWLKKQASYKTLLNSETTGLKLSPAERDPVLLKSKADSFLQSRDYDSAISCYGLAVYLGCKLPEIFLNRGLCHLLRGNLHKVLEDMEKALEYLDPPVEENRRQRMVAYWRRGIAFFGLKLYTESLIELSGALNQGEVSELEKAAQKVRHVVESGEEVHEYSWMMVETVSHPD